jgi:hypothetical protein
MQTAAFNLTYIMTFRTCCVNLVIVYESDNCKYTCLLEPLWLGIELSHRLFIAVEFGRKILANVMKIVRQLLLN